MLVSWFNNIKAKVLNVLNASHIVTGWLLPLQTPIHLQKRNLEKQGRAASITIVSFYKH